MRDLTDNRSWLLVLILNGITFGIYGIYLTYVMARDTNIACAKDGENTKGLLWVLLLGIVTFGIYGLIWQLMIIKRWANHAQANGATPKCTVLSYLLWNIVGSIIVIGPLVAFAKTINAFNQACMIYNEDPKDISTYKSQFSAKMNNK
ncbi:MAG: DUF4234 domain-containing protein [Clostridia bacterium]|nr:DUF4234 domain-containing protein [Clostridia bacterium]